MVDLNKYLKGRGRSSITVDKQLRRIIDDLKEQIENATGTSVTDVDFMYHLLENYDLGAGLLSIAKQIIEKTQELVISYEDYQKLKEENEELRKQIEELKSRQTETKPPEDPEEAYNLFVKAILDRVPSDARKDVERSLRLFQLAIFSDGVNIEILKRLGEWAEEMAYLIKFDKENKEDYETEMRGGVTLW